MMVLEGDDLGGIIVGVLYRVEQASEYGKGRALYRSYELQAERQPDRFVQTNETN